MRPSLQPDGREGSVLGRSVPQQVRRLFDGAPGPGDATLLCRRALVAVHRGPETVDGQIGQLLGDPLEPLADVVKVACHAGTLRR